MKQIKRSTDSRIVIVLLTVIALAFVGCQAIRPVPTTLFIDGNFSVLEKTLIYKRPNSTNVIIVPEGFVTDFTSVPRAFWSLYQRTGRYQWAAVVHDYLYWEQSTTREEADKIFLEAMEESGVNAADRTIIFKAIRSGGDSAWKENALEKLKGLPRIIPPSFRNIPANTTWGEYRKKLYDAGIRP